MLHILKSLALCGEKSVSATTGLTEMSAAFTVNTQTQWCNLEVAYISDVTTKTIKASLK